MAVEAKRFAKNIKTGEIVWVRRFDGDRVKVEDADDSGWWLVRSDLVELTAEEEALVKQQIVDGV